MCETETALLLQCEFMVQFWPGVCVLAAKWTAMLKVIVSVLQSKQFYSPLWDIGYKGLFIRSTSVDVCMCLCVLYSLRLSREESSLISDTHCSRMECKSCACACVYQCVCVCVITILLEGSLHCISKHDFCVGNTPHSFPYSESWPINTYCHSHTVSNTGFTGSMTVSEIFCCELSL